MGQPHRKEVKTEGEIALVTHLFKRELGAPTAHQVPAMMVAAFMPGPEISV
jgi:hypothetical protein